MRPETEEGVLRALCRYLRKEGFVVAREVPFMSKKIDAAAVKPRGRTVIAVEAKAKDWPRGLSQALTYQLWAHRVYVAVAADHQRNVDRSLLRQHGVGLVVVDGGVRTLVAARPSTCVSPDQAEELKRRVLRKGRR